MSIDGLGLKDIKVRFSAGEMFDVFAVQGDTLTRGFRATLIDPKTLKPLTPSESFTLQLIAERPENPDQYIVTDGVIEGDQYVVYLTTMQNIWEVYQARKGPWLTEFFSFGIMKKTRASLTA